MAAAATLALAVCGAYAVLLLATAGVDGGSAVLRLGGAVEAAGRVLFRPPTAQQTLHVAPGASGVARPTGRALRIDLGRLQSTSSISDAVQVTNTSDVSRQMHLDVSGAPGVEATFTSSGAGDATVPPRSTVTVAITSRADHAGPISGQLEVDVKGSTGAPLTLPVAGAQAPLPVPQVTARPLKGGAVAVNWAPSPSTGVAAYAVYRASAPGKPAARIAETVGTHTLDRTAPDGPAVYEVRPITAGVTPELLGQAGSPAPALVDSTAPQAPTSWSAPAVINAASAAQTPVSVVLPASSSADDQVSVGLGDSTRSVSAPAAHGGGPVSVTLDASTLADGVLHPFVTLTDPLGNSATYTAPDAVSKDTVAPQAPASVSLTDGDAPAATINAAGAAGVQVRVAATPDPGDQVVAELNAPAAGVQAQAPAGEGPVQLDASSLPDGPLTLSAWLVDAAGNASPRVQLPVVKDTLAPRAPIAVTSAPDETAPPGFVNAASQAQAVVLLTFDGPTNSANSIQADVAGTPVSANGGPGQVALGPLDLSGLPDGPVPVSGTITDEAGNVTSFSASLQKDTVAPQAPTAAIAQADADTPRGTVDADDRSCVDVEVSFAAATDPSDTIAARLSQGDVEAQASVPGGSDDVWLRCLDLSAAAAGRVELSGSVRDAAGNSSDWTGTPLLLLPDADVSHPGGDDAGDGQG